MYLKAKTAITMPRSTPSTAPRAIQPFGATLEVVRGLKCAHVILFGGARPTEYVFFFKQFELNGVLTVLPSSQQLLKKTARGFRRACAPQLLPAGIANGDLCSRFV